MNGKASLIRNNHGYRSSGIIAKIRLCSQQKSCVPFYPMLLNRVLCRIAHLGVVRSLGSGLLVQVGLNTTLLSLALIMLGLELCLVGLVASDASDSTTDSARDTVGNTRAEI